MNTIIAAIKKEGIKAEDIKTNDYSINPKYDYDKNTGRSSIVGYTVSNILKVTVKDIMKVGQVIDIAVKNGANTSNSISFGISDYDTYYNKALLKALSNAQGKAQAISSFLAVKLTTPVKIIENSNGIPNDYPISFNGKLESAASSDSTSLQAGVYKVKADVSLVYQY
ncbi:26 kDa periplasmic immunogenic protein [bioreactor metagenome]|uniref:26 kDa periplasmic immunogenic protein n=1 Tax=bioreactor metagenome TaxID=1076179 RepID=A0A645I6Z7_9ZZZZ